MHDARGWTRVTARVDHVEQRAAKVLAAVAVLGEDLVHEHALARTLSLVGVERSDDHRRRGKDLGRARGEEPEHLCEHAGVHAVAQDLGKLQRGERLRERASSVSRE